MLHFNESLHIGGWPLTTNAGAGIGDFSAADNLKFLHIFYVDR